MAEGVQVPSGADRARSTTPPDSADQTLVAGVDCSTQSTKVVVCRADDGVVVAAGSAAHPPGTEVDPRAWWTAFEQAAAGLPDGLLGRVSAIGVGGQQHGLVLTDSAGDPVRDALLWNDTRSAADAAELIDELGGRQAWADAVGSVPVASMTVTKLRWVARHDHAAASRAVVAMLPHDYLTMRLTGAGPTEATTDRGDASGTAYWSPARGEYRMDLFDAAFGRSLHVPRVAAPAEVVGRTEWGAAVSAGTGDNMAAALGLGLQPGDVVVSLGTSGTAFALCEQPSADVSGAIAGFADATGAFLPLVCTMNCALVLDAVGRLLGVDHAGLAELALAAGSGAGGLTLLPYFDGERTPDLPTSTGALTGLTAANLTRPAIARAAVEGVLLGLADAVDRLRAADVPVRRVLLIGGLARNAAVRECAVELLGAPVHVPQPAEYVALGAARQAAWALSGAAVAPDWPVLVEQLAARGAPGESATAAELVRAPFRRLRHQLYGV